MPKNLVFGAQIWDFGQTGGGLQPPQLPQLQGVSKNLEPAKEIEPSEPKKSLWNIVFV